MKFNEIISRLIPLVTLYVLLAASLCFSQTPSAFCDGFEDGEPSWRARWQNVSGVQLFVPGSHRLRFYGTGGVYGCHSSMYRKNFVASAGEYSASMVEITTLAGLSLYVQVDTVSTVYPPYRACYMAGFAAYNSQGGGGLTLYKRDAVNGYLLASKPAFFPMSAWIRGFVRILPGGVIIAGYDSSGGRDSLVYIDPSPITAPGLFLPF